MIGKSRRVPARWGKKGAEEGKHCNRPNHRHDERITLVAVGDVSVVVIIPEGKARSWKKRQTVLQHGGI